jgi:hypothetical protein
MIDHVPVTFHDPTKLLNALAQDMTPNLRYLELALLYLTERLAETFFSLLPQTTITTLRLFVSGCVPSEGSAFDVKSATVWLPYNISFL